MNVEIPWSRIKDIAIRPQLFSGEQEGSLGGPSLPLPRMGDRFAVDIETTQFRQDAESRRFMALLFLASNSGAKIRLRQPNRSRMFVGEGEIDGVGQSGSILKAKVLRNAAFVLGDFFSIVHDGVNYVHMVAEQAISDNEGRVSLPIWPMLRFITTATDEVSFAAPMIEGKLVGFDKGAGFQTIRTKPFTFSIVERA